ncbi:phosphoadenylyl-sulfate reductase [Nostocoides sp. F2B08]|uniref:phosphoadenylyl-sulfate reductase n=1 Tax=Nostocoides sp. F2B08 TaxID=2653936 RepID=UPI0012635931|nr:phosphoadenylyl-sulfate reductase [Tetrasphaera sp. F2B08]KAB7746341.1 phosphoadenylyl-sulfate reductase [Tetrasphaera sp. F2B08]
MTTQAVADARAEAEQAAHEYARAGAEEVLTWAAHRFGRDLAVAASMADTVLPHLVSRVVPDVDVVFLDTGYHFPETLATRDEAARVLDITVRDIRPELTVAEQDARFGHDLFARDPGACCRMRKVEPLRRALSGYSAWVTGVRRDEAPTRAATPIVEWDETFGLVKVNPLVAWTADDVTAYASRHDLPTNPLLERGYPSIGCAPCTRPVAPGQDPRSGRWSGFAKTECGLHPATIPATTTPAATSDEETR